MMKTVLPATLIVWMFCTQLFAAGPDPDIIVRANGNIVFAYKNFERYLQSDKSWQTYESMVLDSHPAMSALHRHNLKYGFIDSVQFQGEMQSCTLDDYVSYLNNVSDEKLVRLYDSVIERMDDMLTPLDSVDVVFYLPYGRDCFIMGVGDRMTIYISIKYPVEKMEKILVHEYAHNLHHQRWPEEPSVLKRWVVSEGFASYFLLLLSDSATIYDGLWMMPRENVDWCMTHEEVILDSLALDLEKGGLEISKKYIAGGEGFATPPKGFPEKTGYYIGYRIVETCLDKGVTMTEICGMTTQQIMEKSKIFN